MRITGLDRLEKARVKHPDADTALAAWVRVTLASDWHSIVQVRQTFRSADAAQTRGGRTVTIFNVRGNNYRLITAIDYSLQVVHVLTFLTHAEYDKEQWKKTL